MPNQSASCLLLQFIPLLMNKTPRYLNSTWQRDSSPTQSGHSTLSQLRKMAWDLEVLIFIPTASHSAANCASEPNPTPFGTWLRLESVHKIYEQNRWREAVLVESVNRSQSWSQSTVTGNKSDLLRLCKPDTLQEYRDWTARSVLY